MLRQLQCLIVAAVVLSSATAFADTATYDLVRYTAPTPWNKIAWKREVKDKNTISYTLANKQDHSYCQIFLLRSMTSKGDITTDFESDWRDVVIKSYGVTEAPQLTDTAAEGGWEVKAGIATFQFDSGTSIAMLTTITGYGRTVSIVAVTSNQDYLTAIQGLLGSIEMIKPTASASTSTPAKAAPKEAAKGNAKPTALQGYMDYNPFTKTWTWKLRYPPK